MCRELIEEDDKAYKLFYGTSSSTAMNKYSRGVAVKLPYCGNVKETVLDIQGGIRSAMTYIGAKKIKDIPKCTT